MAEETSMGSVRDNAAAPDAPGHPRRRTGCSCWTILLFLVFLVIVVTGGSYLSLRYFIDKMTIGRMTTAERTDYLQWLTTPITIPEEWRTTFATPMSKEVRDERTATIAELNTLYSHLNDATSATETMYARMNNNGALDEENARAIMTAAAPHIGIFDRMNALASQPDYSLIESLAVYDGEFFNLSQGGPVSIIMAEHRLGYSLQALDHLESFIRFYHTRTPVLTRYLQIHSQAVVAKLNLTQYITQDDTDGSLSARALTMLNDNLTSTLGTGAPAEVISESETIALYLFKYEHPLTQSGSITPQQMTRLLDGPRWTSGAIARVETYTWLEKQLPPDDPQHSLLRTAIANYSTHFTRPPSATWAQKLERLTGARAYHYLNNNFVAFATEQSQNIHLWKLQRDGLTFLTRSAIQYDLLRLFLARRLAELRGDPLPVTQSDFVPRYLPDWPADPYSPTDDGFQFDATTGEFYSIGPDATAATPDDIQLDKLPARTPSSQPHDDDTTSHTGTQSP